jgi:hypothetical protein
MPNDSRPCVPDELPLVDLDYRRLLPLVGQANAALARYDGLLQGIHEKTTAGLLRQMRDAGILREPQPGSGRRPATLCFPRLINLAEGREVL